MKNKRNIGLPDVKQRRAALTLAALMFALPLATFADPLTADEQLYTSTVATMRALPQPENVSFVAKVTGEGLSNIGLIDDHGSANIHLGVGKGTPAVSWPTTYRASDDLASIMNEPESHVLSHEAIFIPTWTGVHDWMLFGLHGRPSSANSSASPEPSMPAASSLKVIGMVKVIGINFYRITGANAALCPGGAQGRHLQLEARNDPATHPLTDVTIDLASMRFCSMRFRLALKSNAAFVLNATGSSELHFGDVDGFWMTLSSDSEILVRTLGIGVHRAKLLVTYEGMHFPETIDAGLFAVPH